MAEIPEIVRSRLKQQSAEVSAVHPDANLLAAFAERTLAPRERDVVTEHLARCADCREYLAVAFAAQEREPAAESRLTPARPRRRWFLAWRWLAPAAVACCIVAVALQYYVHPTPEKIQIQPALSSPPPPKPAPAADVTAVNKLQTIAPARPAAKKFAVRKFSAPAPPAEAAVVNGALPASPDLVAPAPQANATAVVLQQGRDTLAKAQREARAAGVAGSAQAGAAAGFVVAPRENAYSKAKLAAPRMMQRVASALEPAAANVRWSINASPDTGGNSRGVVQKSTDAGATWQVVALSERVSFLAVASAGPHVWAGGSEGALFHSSDGGSHWDQISVAGGNTTLTGSIVHIDAVNPGVVRITTSTGEHWATADGGRTWKQE